MDNTNKIKSALISVFSKEGLAPIIEYLHKENVTIYSTGGTQAYIESLHIPVERVEDLTTYPSILDGRVKTLHPKVFGGILAMRTNDHLSQLNQYDIPPIDLVIVDLYPFEQTVAKAASHEAIIEKIDIGGISLIRAAAKNYQDVTIICQQSQYSLFLEILSRQDCHTSLEQRKEFATIAFNTSSHYDNAIHAYLGQYDTALLSYTSQHKEQLRYGENPHQEGYFIGDLSEIFEIYGGKQLSYNNLVDIDAGVQIIGEFRHADPTFAIIKHTNTCGLAMRSTVLDAYKAALACDPTSAFGGIFVTNTTIDAGTAEEINTLFYEVVIAPSFTDEALSILTSKAKRIILRLKSYIDSTRQVKSILGGILVQDHDRKDAAIDINQTVTNRKPTTAELEDLYFASIAAKHLKSNTITLVKDKQLIGMGCGQTSRIDACEQAIQKARHFGFELNNAVMASDAFFPFPDCIELAHKVGIRAVVQPGGSIKDNLSIEYCNQNDIAMVCTGTRHFKH